jgi:dihydroxyacetone kinase-like protein
MRSISGREFIELLCHVSQSMERARERLTELDSAIGDGDMGVSMSLGWQAIASESPRWIGDDCGEIMRECGSIFGHVAPSTIGALFSTGFQMGGATVVGKSELGASELLEILVAADEGIRRRGRAKPGDKTLLDALVPAINAIRKGIEDSVFDLEELLNSAAVAANDGANWTKDLRATRGRSRWLQDRTVGHLDPGAAAVAEIFKASADWFRSRTAAPALE